MKTGISLLALVLMGVSFQTFADKIVITGEPVMLEHRGDLYYLPQDYTVGTTYNYVNVECKQMVCYLEPQPAIATLTPVTINIEVGGAPSAWQCYPFETTYFEVRS